MTYKVTVTTAAKQDLRSAFRWAAERTPQAAALWLQRFEAELQSLESFPMRFQLAPENALVDLEIRQLIFGKRQAAYRVLYTVVGQEVQILHIRRAIRDWATPDELVAE